ncbi:MAG: haloacid dehalogenase-like hydrolase [Bdellovibrionales bacterium]|jgi:phosphoserine phosphatase|nr:haloacid dehalogenase-like hydrolase [Bdellovibrionales bacterium]
MVSKALEAVNEFSSALWSDVDAFLERTLVPNNIDESSIAHGERPIAVFDADGTLWDKDAGETFFQWQIDNCGFSHLSDDPWGYYHNWKKRDPHGAYGWLAQISAGHELGTVRNWAQLCYESQKPWPVFQSIQDLFKILTAAEFDLYVVTASVKWAVEPAAYDLLGVPPENVLGIETETFADANGRIIVTDMVKSPITYRQGKADALLRATGGRKPVLAAGNTLGDIALLDLATDFKLMIQSQSPLLSENSGLLAEEKKLRDHGKPLGWRLHAFRS